MGETATDGLGNRISNGTDINGNIIVDGIVQDGGYDPGFDNKFNTSPLSGLGKTPAFSNRDSGIQTGSNGFINNPLAQNLNYFDAPFRNGKAETNKAGLPLVLKENPSRSDLTKSPELEVGIPSFINPYAILSFPTKWGSDNSPFGSIMDDPSSPRKFSTPSYVTGRNGLMNIEPTVYNLVNTPPDGSNSDIPAFGAKTPYRYTDFLYCKYYGKIPNNFLITLRRYPAPTFDNLAIPQTKEDIGASPTRQFNFKPIAQAVSWIGDETENKISDIMGFDVAINWKLYESQVETYNGNEQDASQGPKMFESASKFLQIVSGALGGKTNDPTDQANYNYDPYANGPYSHRVYGPVNVIGKTYKRDRGIDFKQSFNINFHYALKSISGINPKAAMLDIMNNMLQLTYNNAAFWGGANRYFAQKPVYPFLGGRDGMNAWYRGDPVGFTKSVVTQLNADGGTLSLIGNFFESLSADPVAALKGLLAKGTSMGMKIIGKGRAPDIVGMKALLTGEPIGEWHMVIGNPYSPILQIGNLICTGAKFKFNDVLGADNFPTELKVTIALEHGRPRDMGDIASMFNEGEGRMYFAPMGKAELFVSTSLQNSKNDNSYSKSQRDAGSNRQIENAYPLYKDVETKSKTNDDGSNNTRKTRSYVQPGSAKIGASSEIDQIIAAIQFPFQDGQNGHALAIKMGLASSGVKQQQKK